MANYGYGQPLGYSREFTQQREATQLAEEQRLREQKAANDVARAEYLAGLEGQRAEQAKRAEQELDAELEPAKVARRRAWLIDHPGHGPSDFDKVWPLVREELVEERRQAQYDQTLAKMRASSDYRF